MGGPTRARMSVARRGACRAKSKHQTDGRSGRFRFAGSRDVEKSSTLWVDLDAHKDSIKIATTDTAFRLRSPPAQQFSFSQSSSHSECRR